MFNNEQQHGHFTSMPRISFSSDFADSQQQVIKHHESSYREPPVSSDFAFSLSHYGMIAPADEVISKGKLLPLKEEHCSKMTLRDELLVDDDDDEYESVFSRWQPKGSGRWKERLGLKRAQAVPKKADKSEELYAEHTGPNWATGYRGGKAM